MGDKYYTPTIEEFGVGFEYQVQEKRDVWVSKIANSKTNFGTIDDLIHGVLGFPGTNISIRVKFLDREDIESLGWVFSKENWKGHGMLNAYSIEAGEHKHYELYFCRQDKSVRIQENSMFTLFDGTIRNKSELRRVMKMVGIEVN